MEKTKKNEKIKSVNDYGITPYLFVLPGVLLFVLIAIVPMFESAVLSFTNWDGVKKFNMIEFVGLRNYVKALSGSQFLISMKNNLIWAAVSVTIPIAIGLVQAAVIVNSRVKGKNLFQLLLFLPQILSSMIMSIMWLEIFNPAQGLINSLLGMVGLGNLQRAWLGDKSTALFCLILVSIWAGYGFNTILYCTAIRSVDKSMYEAAKIDGASSGQVFRYITVPSIRPTTRTLILLALIGAFKVFDTVFQMTKGGPGYYTSVTSYYLYSTAFTENKIGMGCAIAIIQSAIVLTISGVYQKLGGEKK